MGGLEDESTVVEGIENEGLEQEVAKRLEEAKKQEKKQAKRRYKWFFGCAEICLIVWGIFQPEPKILVYLAYTLGFFLLSFVFSKRLLTVYILLGIFFVLPMSYMVNFAPQRGYWMYASKLKEFREHYQDRPEVFASWPSDYPEGATNRRFEYMPSFLQGRGYMAVRFEADDEYIDELIETYGQDAETNVCLLDEGLGVPMYYQVRYADAEGNPGDVLSTTEKEQLRCTTEQVGGRPVQYIHTSLLMEHRLPKQEGTIVYVQYLDGKRDTEEGVYHDHTKESMFYVNRETHEVGFVFY